MSKTAAIIYLGLVLLLPLEASAIEVGDPDSESAPLVLEPETLPTADDNVNDDNPDAHADDANNVKPAEPEPVPGAHLVAPEATEALPAPEEDDKWYEMKFARLQGLNKVTAKTSEIKADIGAKTKFGNLEFTVEKCLRRPENEKFENTALFTIWDEIPGQEKKQVFHGWMFSSSPALSALEHPIYDIILLGCGEAPKAAAIPAADAKKTSASGGAKKKTKKPKMSMTVQ